jgi:uncharacterized protein (TIGR03435 family)
MGRIVRWTIRGAAVCLLLGTGLRRSFAQPASFAIATIRPSAAEVKFEHDGSTEVAGDMLRMRDVTVDSCIKWAYDVQNSQIAGPAWMDSDRFDITAKTEGPATIDEMKTRLKALLADRFHLTFQHEQREMKALILTVTSSGPLLKPAAAPDAPPYHQNSANGTIAKSMPIPEFANFIAGPLQMPVVDETGLTGKYDFAIDFTPYLESGNNMSTNRPDATALIKIVMHDQLGLNIEGRRAKVEVMVIDTVTRPSAN